MLTHSSTATGQVQVFAGQIGGQSLMVCSARELHAAVGAGRDFSTWMKDRIQTYEFQENIDYQVFTETGENSAGGRPGIGYLISMDMAKELAMVERSEAGKAARKYFIECERKLSRLQASAISLPQMISAQKHCLQLIKAIKAEPNESIKHMIHSQLGQICMMLGTAAPALDSLAAVAIGDNDAKTLAEFWDAYRAIGPDHLNHSHDSTKIAINMAQLEQRASEKKIALPEKARLQRALRESQNPRFVAVKSVASRINTKLNAEMKEGDAKLPPTVKCWVFEQVEG